MAVVGPLSYIAAIIARSGDVLDLFQNLLYLFSLLDTKICKKQSPCLKDPLLCQVTSEF